ncbi:MULTISPECIES: HAD family hydrolase [Deferrisoma]
MTAVWAFDLDNTLYPAECGLFREVDRRIRRFMAERVGIPPAEIPGLRAEYKRRYGVTLGGLLAHHGVDPEEYLAYVHDVPVERYLQPDPSLAESLEALPGERVIFTNGSVGHTRRVLEALGVAPLFSAVFDIAFMGYVPKPRPQGYERLLRALAVAPSRCILVDDLPENLATAKALGMRTVGVGPAGPRDGHPWVASPRELPRVWEQVLGDGGSPEPSPPTGQPG